MDCPLRSGHDLAEAYVAGTLPEAEQDAYEQHFFSCSACLAQVQTLQELADRLRQLPAPAVLHRAPTPGWTSAPWLGLALAAGLVAAFGWWWQGGVNRPAPPPIATGPGTAPKPTPAPAPAPAASSRHAVLAQLALIVPPRYVPLAVRGQSPPAGSFDAAMAHYVAGRHREAAAALRTLSEATPADPDAAFFWGVTELALGHTAAARDGLTRAIAADVQPYADEAHFYLAKAYLAEEAVDQARTELRYAVAHEAGPEGEAQRLLAALDRLPP
jgi:hypothetical protein